MLQGLAIKREDGLVFTGCFPAMASGCGGWWSVVMPC